MAALLGTAACSTSDTPVNIEDPDETGATNTGPTTPSTETTSETDPKPEPESGFEDGKYQFNELMFLDSEFGADLTGDGEINNIMPGVLALVNLAIVDEDFSIDGINYQIQSSLDNDLAIVLMRAVHADAILDVEILVGQYDDEQLVVDPGSYDNHGDARSSLIGGFTDDTQFVASTDFMTFPLYFFEDQPPFMMVLELAQLEGTLDIDESRGQLYGAIPITTMMTEVVVPLIPDDGYNCDFDPAIETKEECIELILEIALGFADIDLPNGEKGLSTAFSYVADRSSWPDP